MTAEHGMRTRDRIIAEAMRLFGEQGYTKTTIAEIERAAGLSQGSGALYRHFRSKDELLAEGVRSKIAENAGLLAALRDRDALAILPQRERLILLARAGLRRLDAERDLNRILVRDLARFPALLDEVGEGEMHRVYQATAQWLRAQWPADPPPERDWLALAAVLIGSVSHYWLLRDVFGGSHPAGIDEQRYFEAFADVAEGLFGSAKTGDVT